jgi:hypothetical protein
MSCVVDDILPQALEDDIRSATCSGYGEEADVSFPIIPLARAITRFPWHVS